MVLDNINENISNAKYIDLNAKTGYNSGISNLDNIFRIDKKQLTVVTGKANQGKTTFLDYFVFQLAKTAGLKTLFISYEVDNDWKSHATLTLLAKQDLPTFGYNMIDPLKPWCWGSILFYPFKISRFS